MKETKEPIKVNVSTFLLIIAMIIIGVMAYFMYSQKMQSDKEIANLQDEAKKSQATINELQNKLDNVANIANNKISNTEEKTNIENKTNSTATKENDEIQYDYELTIGQIEEELKSSNYDDSTSKMREFRNKYQNKKIKVSGYVTYADDNNSDEVVWADEYEGRTGSVALGDKDNYKTKSRVLGYTGDMNEINKISKLQVGQEITIIGTAAIGGYLDLKDIVILENK